MSDRYLNHGKASQTSSRANFAATHALRQLTQAGPSDGPAQDVAPANITVVRTARELQVAIASGAQDVQVRSHLDLSSLALDISSKTLLADTRRSTRTIRGNCTSPPPLLSEWDLEGPPLLWTAPQCLIVTDQDFLRIGEGTRLWLDALYLRARPTRWRHFIFLHVDASALLYATRMTLQGDGAMETMVVQTWDDSQVYLQGSTVDSVGGSRPLFDVYLGSAFLQRVTLSNVNHTWAGDTSAFDDGAQPGSAPAPSPTSVSDSSSSTGRATGVFVVWGGSASLVAFNMTVDKVSTPRGTLFLTYEGGLVVAEDTADAEDVVHAYDYDYAEAAAPAPGDDYAFRGRVKRAETVSAAPASVVDAFPAGRVPLATWSDPWFAALRKAIGGATPSQLRDAPEPPPNPPPPPFPGVAGDAPPQIAAVYSAAQLQRAFHAGVRDIEIRSHMDLRGLPKWGGAVSGGDSGLFQLGFVGKETRSIRGRCETPPPAALTPAGLGITMRADTEEPWRAPRCVLFVADDLFAVDSLGLWLDALHIQIAPELADDDADYVYSYSTQSSFGFDYSSSSGQSLIGVLVMQVLGWAKLYVTDCAIQGDGSTPVAAAWVVDCSGGLYMRGSVINGVPGPQLRFSDDNAPPVLVSFGAALFESCTFAALDGGPAADPPDYEGNYFSDAVAPLGSGLMHARGSNASVALRNCSLPGANAAGETAVSAGHAAAFFSDHPGLMVEDFDYYSEWWDRGDPEERPEAFPAAPIPGPGSEGRRGRYPAPPQASDRWFVAAQEALESPPPEAYLSKFPAASSDEGFGLAPGEAAAPGPANDASPAPATAPGDSEAMLLPPSASRGPLAELQRTTSGSASGMGTAAKIGIVLGVLCVLAVATWVAAIVHKRLRGRRVLAGSSGGQRGKAPEAASAGGGDGVAGGVEEQSSTPPEAATTAGPDDTASSSVEQPSKPPEAAYAAESDDLAYSVEEQPSKPPEAASGAGPDDTGNSSVEQPSNPPEAASAAAADETARQEPDGDHDGQGAAV